MNSYKTIQECANILAQNLFIMEQQYDHKEIFSFGDQLPVFAHFNRREDLLLTYISKLGGDLVHLETEEIVMMKEEFFDHYIHPFTINKIFPQFLMLNATRDYSTFITETQMILSPKGWSESLTVTKKTPNKKDFISLSAPLNMIEKSLSLSNLLEDNEFIRDNFHTFQSLTYREKEILNFIAEGYTNKQVGERLHISEHTVRTHRNNIWKKLSKPSFKELINFQRNFLKDFNTEKQEFKDPSTRF